jgi:hypothetical protein
LQKLAIKGKIYVLCWKSINPTSLAKGKAVIKTSGKDNKPELIFEYPTYVEHTVYHNSPTEQETCIRFYSLKPYETKPLIWS